MYGSKRVRELFGSIAQMAAHASNDHVSTADAYAAIERDLKAIEQIVLTAKEEEE